MKNFKFFLEGAIIATYTLLAFLFVSYAQKSILQYLISFMLVLLVSYATCLVWKMTEDHQQKAFNQKRINFAEKVIKNIEASESFNSEKFVLALKLSYIDLFDTQNKRIIGTWKLPDINDYKVHPTLFNETSVQELTEQVIFYLTDYQDYLNKEKEMEKKDEES